MPVPASRIRLPNDRPIDAAGSFVLYWMIANRRLRWNFSLDRAVELARELERPLLILEPLRVGYRWASDRLHAFAFDGMGEHADMLEGGRVGYYPYVETREGEGAGLLEALASKACAVVTDDYPAFFLPRMIAAAATRLPVRLEAVDSNGLLPMRGTDRVFSTAYSFRRHLQGTLPRHLGEQPRPEPLADLSIPPLESLPRDVTRGWPPARTEWLKDPRSVLADLPIDHSVGVATEGGGWSAARRRLDGFLEEALSTYDADRNEPDRDGSSGLSPYLHWGHLSVHEVFDALTSQEGWTPARLAEKADGRRAGWWGMSPAAESFLDELVTWREIGFNMCSNRPDEYDQYNSLPDWALETLEEHAQDPRPQLYDLEQFESAATHDELWNAAQRQLVREGRIHNYLRMLWGKKILEWTPHPRDALSVMMELNNKYALDGRDPNSYTGIFWVLGRYDRGWPERPVFGKVRTMTSASTRRKYSVGRYLRRFGE